MLKKFKYLKQEVSEKECEYLIQLYQDILQSIGTLIVNKINSCKGIHINTVFSIVEGSIRNAHENILVQIFKSKDSSVEEINESISKIYEDTKRIVISRVKDATTGMPFIFEKSCKEK